jgi:hypothetical protein
VSRPSLPSLLRGLIGSAGRRRPPRADQPDARRPPRRAPEYRAGNPYGPDGYPGDFTRTLHPAYSPDPDGQADPGEVIWTWVPFEEDHSQGKDRPVLVVGRDGEWLLGLMMTSKDHDAHPNRRGEVWLDLGAGEWDARHRSSEVRVDRVLRVAPGSVRREGAVLDRSRFQTVAAAVESLGRGGPR